MQLIGRVVVVAHQVQRLPDTGQHPQSQHIDLHQSQVVDVVLVPFDEGALGHRGVADRHQLIQPVLCQDEAPDMLGQVAWKAQQPCRHAHRPPDHRIARIQTSLLDVPACDFRAPAAPLACGQAGGHVLGQAQHLADLADGALGAIADDRGGNARAVTAIAVVDMLDDLLASFVLEIHVDVGRLAPVVGQEALEQQVVLGRVHAGDAQHVTDRRVRR